VGWGHGAGNGGMLLASTIHRALVTFAVNLFLFLDFSRKMQHLNEYIDQPTPSIF
jgi:hypothetical protein